MLTRRLLATCTLLAGVLVLLFQAFVPSPISAASPLPQQDGSPGLSDDQKACIVAARFGITPETLAASGYSAEESGLILQTLKDRNEYATVMARCASSGASSSSGGSPSETGSGNSDLANERSQILSAAIPNDQAERLSRLGQCVDGFRIGLPAELSVACTSPIERRLVSEALIAEQRAANLGKPLAERQRILLTSIRTSPAATTAASSMASQLTAIRARFTSAGSPPHP